MDPVTASLIIAGIGAASKVGSSAIDAKSKKDEASKKQITGPEQGTVAVEPPVDVSATLLRRLNEKKRESLEGKA
tara:strand:- start:436 stop:660 length:225 start_codon:yes stop_codon:yes gene_type:complete